MDRKLFLFIALVFAIGIMAVTVSANYYRRPYYPGGYGGFFGGWHRRGYGYRYPGFWRRRWGYGGGFFG
ncbi:hypothetical protein RDWZM_002027 [Blomia tropicalis]|uniref:Uncharacterized protein n=1 Tax=Blomia tropicalis TaxID=40697 RepID=A0A9Q0MFB8_BLOTA|nr:hypothetical protein RDWZM_002027 [Blomia tropicalis]